MRGAEPFVTDLGASAETPAVLAVSAHACVFYDHKATAHCRVHAALGHEALPLACRQFPRVTLEDPRGVSLTLSHYCPTAAAQLNRPESVWIVESPSAFPGTGEYVGLDARDALPPLVRPGMLMDWESWWTLEALAVDLLGNSAYDADAALAALGDAVDRIEDWRPDEGSLTHRVRASLTSARPVARVPGVTVDEVFAAIPEEVRSATPLPSHTAVSDRVRKRFLAAHAFANWAIHLGPGLRAWYRSIEAAHCLIAAGFDVSQADLLLRHLAEPARLANFT